MGTRTRPGQREIVLCGKGGIGKTTVVTNLAVLGVSRGLEVLQVGCDPKHDSCTAHVDRRARTVMDLFREKGRVDRRDIEGLLQRGRTGVWCLETGGPQPGVGCAGRAITLALDVLRTAGDLLAPFDVILFDLLGDVVCGGFATPLRRGPDTAVYLVTSGEILPVYAANNIAHGVRNLANRGGGRVAGLVANLRAVPGERDLLERFASALGTRVAAWIPRDPAVFEAERAGRTLIETAPDSPAAAAIRRLADAIYEGPGDSLVVPTPLDDDAFEALFAAWRPGGAP